MTLRPKRIFRLILSACGCLVILAACGKEEKDYEVKVGEETLTASMIDSALRDDIRDTDSYRLAYTQQWVQSELLHQKAVREGYERNPRFVRRMREIRRELLIRIYLEDEYERGIKVLPQEMDDYYRKHQSGFFTAEDHLQAEYFATQDRGRAMAVARQFRSLSRLRKKDFLDVIRTNMAGTDITGTTEFLPRSRFDQKSGKQLFLKSATDDIIGPLPFGDGYFVIWHIMEIRPKGTPKSFDSVAAEIENRIRAVKKKQFTDELVRKLKNEFPVHYPDANE